MNRRQFLATSLASGVALVAGGAGSDPKLKVAVIGHTGRGDYGHGLDRMWQRLPETEIIAVADADPKGLAAAEKRLAVANSFADYRKMLGAGLAPDIVVVAPRQIDEHRDMILAAVGSGARGIYIEKPLCRTPAEGRYR